MSVYLRMWGQCWALTKERAIIVLRPAMVSEFEEIAEVVLVCGGGVVGGEVCDGG